MHAGDSFFLQTKLLFRLGRLEDCARTALATVARNDVSLHMYAPVRQSVRLRMRACACIARMHPSLEIAAAL